MPAQYEHIKASELKAGKSLKVAKRIAAATYNKTHKSDPMGPNWDKKHGLVSKKAASHAKKHMSAAKKKACGKC